MAATEEQRASELLEAQTKAEALFHAVEARGLIRPGISENNFLTLKSTLSPKTCTE